MARCDSYLFGECTWGVCQQVPWLPEGLGNATDWVARAAADGFTISTEPMVGSVVVYAAGDGYSEFGHVALVVQVASPNSFLVREMNYAGWAIYDQRWSNGYDVEGFILPPGTYVQPGRGSFDSGGGGDQVGDAQLALGSFFGFFGDVLPALQSAIVEARTAMAAVRRF